MRRIRIRFATATATAAALLPLAQPPASAAPVFQEIPSPTPAHSSALLESVSSGSDRSVWAVGSATNQQTGQSAPLIEHFDGSAWHIVTASGALPAIADLHGVASVGDGVAIVAGFASNPDYSPAGGVAAIKRPNQPWAALHPPAPPTQYWSWNRVVASSANDFWLLGEAAYGGDPDGFSDGIAAHWQGGHWHYYEDTSMPAVSGATQLSNGNIVIVGDNRGNSCCFGNGSAIWNGSAWQPAGSFGPNPHQSAYLISEAGVSGTTPANVWAVGYDYENGHNMVWRLRNGGQWQPLVLRGAAWLNRSINAVLTLSPSDTWVTGNGGSGILLAHWNGSGWTSTLEGRPGGLTALAKSPTGRIWAVGTRAGKTLTLRR